MSTERILIAVKTYPTLSRKHGELVCTAGLRENGTWMRIYPVPFRLLEYQNRYSKYDWIETSFSKSTRDPRPESFRPNDPGSIRKVGRMDTHDNWYERRNLVLGKATVYDRLDDLIDAAHANTLSLAVFKPKAILDFISESTDRDWDPEKVDEMRSMGDQGELFGTENWRDTLKLIPKVPYKFSYRFTDMEGKKSTLQVLDWEIGQLYWNCLKSAEGDEGPALRKVRQKYFDTFIKTDLHFFLGTTLNYHRWATNPWVIIGVFPAPHAAQRMLFR
jgi:hypothetical protein